MAKTDFKSIDEYLQTLPPEIRAILEQIRQVIHQALPEAEEIISYQIPAFRLNNRIVIFFAGYKSHASVYPIPAGTLSYRKKIEPYVKGKGTLQFLLDKPVPFDLIEKTALFLAKERAK
jgi:uncharacterized protein YdhG (YjbR/CyaY superfamily)